MLREAASCSRKALANALLACAEKRAAAEDQTRTRFLWGRVFSGGLPPYKCMAASQISDSVRS